MNKIQKLPTCIKNVIYDYAVQDVGEMNVSDESVLSSAHVLFREDMKVCRSIQHRFQHQEAIHNLLISNLNIEAIITFFDNFIENVESHYWEQLVFELKERGRLHRFLENVSIASRHEPTLEKMYDFFQYLINPLREYLTRDYVDLDTLDTLMFSRISRAMPLEMAHVIKEELCFPTIDDYVDRRFSAIPRMDESCKYYTSNVMEEEYCEHILQLLEELELHPRVSRCLLDHIPHSDYESNYYDCGYGHDYFDERFIETPFD